MSLNQGLTDLVAVALVAALAPLVVAVLPGPRIPQVVVFLFSGVLIGPHVLRLAEPSSIRLLAHIGLGFLFLLAGYELDPALLRLQPGRLAIRGWLISALLVVMVAAGLAAADSSRTASRSGWSRRASSPWRGCFQPDAAAVRLTRSAK